MQGKTIHEGRNVKRIREMLGIKQDALANDLGLSQQAISQLEQKEALDKEMLEKISDVLKVPVEAIKNFTEENALNIISNNTFENCAQPASIFYNSVVNPFDKWLEALEEIRKLNNDKVELLERMLKDRDFMIEKVEKMLHK